MNSFNTLICGESLPTWRPLPITCRYWRITVWASGPMKMYRSRIPPVETHVRAGRGCEMTSGNTCRHTWRIRRKWVKILALVEQSHHRWRCCWVGTRREPVRPPPVPHRMGASHIGLHQPAEKKEFSILSLQIFKCKMDERKCIFFRLVQVAMKVSFQCCRILSGAVHYCTQHFSD